MKQQKNKVFKSQKEYMRYLRWRRCATHIITVCSIVLLLIWILSVNPHSFDAWLLFAAYVLFMVILSYHAEQEYLKKDKDVANEKAQAKLAAENRKRINKRR